MNKLHFKTTIKRIKDLMLSPDFNEMKVTEFYPGIFTLVFPNDVKIVVDLAPGHLGYASPYELFYSKGEDHGWTSEKMEITSNVPKPFQGFPIALVSASLMSVAFMGFSNLV